MREKSDQRHGGLSLRRVLVDDLDLFFAHQRDPAGVRMAAFTSKSPEDETAFRAKWEKILADDSIEKRTIVVDSEVVGHVASFMLFGKPQVTYWIGREHWGKGYATDALKAFLAMLTTRPLYASVAAHNEASARVLEKCGFVVIGREKAFANGLDEEIEEILFQLE